MQEQKYKVSVIIPNYNYAGYLKKRIKVIEKQTYPIYELIVLDDCSTDKSRAVIEKMAKKYPIKMIFNEENSGCVFKQWQKGIEAATGDYIWIAEADDQADKKFLENMVKKFEDPEVVLAFSDSKQINEHGRVIRKTCSDLADEHQDGRYHSDYINDGIDEITNYLIVKNYIYNASGVVFKNGDYHDILEECTKFHLAGDWYFYIQVLKRGKVAYVAKPLNYHRIHTNSVTKTTKKQNHYDEVVRIQEEIKKEYPVSDQVLKEVEDQRQKLKQVLGL